MKQCYQSQLLLKNIYTIFHRFHISQHFLMPKAFVQYSHKVWVYFSISFSSCQVILHRHIKFSLPSRLKKFIIKIYYLWHFYYIVMNFKDWLPKFITYDIPIKFRWFEMSSFDSLTIQLILKFH